MLDEERALASQVTSGGCAAADHQVMLELSDLHPEYDAKPSG